MNDPVINYLRRVRKQRRNSTKTAARRAANARARKRREQTALHHRLQNHAPREPRPELLSATKHDAPIEVPALTLMPSSAFLVSAVRILDPEDVCHFAARCLGEEHQRGGTLRSFCPLHPSLEERALTLVEYRAAGGAAPLVHCRRCGYALPLLDFITEMGIRVDSTPTMAKLTWPEKVRRGIINETVIAALCQQRLHRVVLDTGRWFYASMVVENGLQAAFGDWAALPDKSLLALFARETILPEFEQDVYLLNILRNWMGEIVAVDVYAPQDYRPLFRHWLVPARDEPLFAVPHWGMCCDPTQVRDLVGDATDAHARELAASRQSLEFRRAVWLRCEPQPVFACLTPPRNCAN